MLITFEDGSTFAQGAAGYNAVPGYELSEHVVIMIGVGGRDVIIEGAIDTSSPYLIIAPALAFICGIDLAHPEEPHARALVQGKWLDGNLYVVDLALLADGGDNGETVVSNVWAFVPDSDFDPDPLPPTLLGFKRCLDNFLFAIDPFDLKFYFG